MAKLVSSLKQLLKILTNKSLQCSRAWVHAKSLQLCRTLWDPVDHSPQGSSIHGILQARNTGVGRHALLQGVFLTQWLNLHLRQLLHCSRLLYHWALREAHPGVCVTLIKTLKPEDGRAGHHLPVLSQRLLRGSYCERSPSVSPLWSPDVHPHPFPVPRPWPGVQVRPLGFYWEGDCLCVPA